MKGVEFLIGKMPSSSNLFYILLPFPDTIFHFILVGLLEKAAVKSRGHESHVAQTIFFTLVFACTIQ